ncbi:RPS31 30S ribosomal protein S31 [Parapedobacter composti]|uniref:RPS31 30S ribosomal protein S31 n=1 Tax=Parapedobacter composti TaxID=623281 RepID=A0A1I1KM44_9SPHI|nr:30S ribosomal protein THX [Parapedobacter composti]SFC61867.1 RPS31 30S ribosomal protein S31 [Parapedobacter composti]
MGKGDKKSKRGKIVNGTYGKRRQRKKNKKKAETVAKAEG